MNTWVLIAIIATILFIIVGFFVEIASIYSCDEEYMDEYRTNKTRGEP